MSSLYLSFISSFSFLYSSFISFISSFTSLSFLTFLVPHLTFRISSLKKYTMSDDDYLRQMEIQRRNFEAQFGDLESMGFEDKLKNAQKESESESESDDSSDDFAKFDSDDDNNSLSSDSENSEEDYQSESEDEAPKVVTLSTSFTSTPNLTSKKDRNLLKAGRAPTLAEIAAREAAALKLTKKQQEQAQKEDDENLENDLKLQRLLQESHILAHQMEYSGADVTLQTLDYEDPTGKARKRALTQRMREISATNSSSKGNPRVLEKMPMNMRKGMVKARDARIAKYEREARDAGIVLSKVKKGEVRDMSFGKGVTLASDRLGQGKKVQKKKRDRGLKINGVGRNTRNGLVIDQKDIDRINNKKR